jgi:hypothetical protein
MEQVVIALETINKGNEEKYNHFKDSGDYKCARIWRETYNEYKKAIETLNCAMAEPSSVPQANELLPHVSGSYVHVITFYDYNHDVIKHTFTDEQAAINKHKELQENRTWGYYNLHKKLIE